MSQLWWNTFRVDLGVFRNIKVSLSWDASKAVSVFLPAHMHQRLCVMPVLNWSSKKSILHLSPGPHWPTLTQEQGGYIRASWPTFNCEARQIRSQSTSGLVQTAYSPMIEVHEKPVGGKTAVCRLGVQKMRSALTVDILWQINERLLPIWGWQGESRTVVISSGESELYTYKLINSFINYSMFCDRGGGGNGSKRDFISKNKR